MFCVVLLVLTSEGLISWTLAIFSAISHHTSQPKRSLSAGTLIGGRRLICNNEPKRLIGCSIWHTSRGAHVFTLLKNFAIDTACVELFFSASCAIWKSNNKSFNQRVDCTGKVGLSGLHKSSGRSTSVRIWLFDELVRQKTCA
ncbi:hypothetical protein CROQUDRAFT_708199 [Cronartium quercuum f. sp. fusiforme G11]|uniref:Uncharacterized protein n=1 Tax=Cronartium quercuum f. sp. fusiforme G11 TaxID=708437 RepID=A0A9P6TAP3_9BASI|nr:hypothetical protein CROQUDRAFT_708199 [Cronartium quercuum f. sp. fusiforme G11]